jgi:hypothetical protein
MKNNRNGKETDDIELMNHDDLVITQNTDENGNKIFLGGGYRVDSFFLNNELSPLTHVNDDIQNAGTNKVTTPFENLAVPAGLFYINQRIPKKDGKEEKENSFEYIKHTTASDELMDKLLDLVSKDKKRKRKSKKNIKLTNKRTRRNS